MIAALKVNIKYRRFKLEKRKKNYSKTLGQAGRITFS